MKSLPLLLGAALAATATTYASLIPLSAFRDVFVSGTPTDQGYLTEMSSTIFGAFNESVSGSSAGATSTASQISVIEPDQLSLSTDVSAESALAGIIQANATSFFSATFTLTEPSIISLLGNSAILLGDSPQHVVDVEFTSRLFQTPFFGFSRFEVGALDETFLLGPGDYVFRTGYTLSALPGESRSLHADLALRATSVPETGSSLLLLLGAFGLLITSRRLAPSA